MQLSEARTIVSTVGNALQMQTSVALYKPDSFLKGYSKTQIEHALKLLAADQFLSIGNTHDQATFNQAIATYDSALYQIFSFFVPDHEFQEYSQLEFGSAAANAMRARFSDSERIPNVETVGSFVNFCRHIGGAGPLYWQKVYTHLGLPYDPASASPFEASDLEGLMAHALRQSSASHGATPIAGQTAPQNTTETAKGCAVIVALIGVVLGLLYWSLR